MEKKETKLAEREISTAQLFNAPVELLWNLWTQAEHLKNWWGPAGFTSTIQKMDVEEGGEWNLTLHGPDGINYPNRSIFKEVVPLRKIVFEHFNPHFITTVLFEPKGHQTLMHWTLLFDTAAMRQTVGKVHKAEEGQRQNIEKLESYLALQPEK